MGIWVSVSSSLLKDVSGGALTFSQPEQTAALDLQQSSISVAIQGKSHERIIFCS
jgi:hypothetical protein